jgi:hypothetical protein
MLPLYIACVLVAVFCGSVAGFILMERSPRFRALALRVLRPAVTPVIRKMYRP